MLNKFFKIKNIILALFGLLLATGIQAAELNIESDYPEVKTGEYFQVKIYLSSEEEINAIEGVLLFPDSILSLQKISEVNSVFSFWPEKPHLSRDGELRFAGLTPGGLRGNGLLVLSATFKGLAAGRADLSLNKTVAYKNDGLGTKTTLTWSGQSVAISDNGPYVQQPSVFDSEPPEDFQPEIARQSDLFDDRWFVVFSTQDKGQGMDYFEIKETRYSFLADWSAWRRATSPYILTDQDRQSHIYVRAVDRAGNIRTVTLPPAVTLAWYENFWFFAIITGAALLLIFFFVLWRKNKKFP